MKERVKQTINSRTLWRRIAQPTSLLLVVLASTLTYADEPTPAIPAHSSGDLIIVVGAPGTDEYQTTFQEWSDEWLQLAEASNLRAIEIGNGASSETTDFAKLQQTLTELDSETSRPLWITLIGHGTFGRNLAKFNLRGPDVSADQLGDWLTRFRRPIVLINNASCSGPFINALSKTDGGANRTIVTATKSGNEQNFARFGKFFVQAMASMDSDLDHDEAVSVREAFLRASNAVDLFYEAENRIATEHALIDDNGDGLGTSADDLRRKTLTPEQRLRLDGTTAARMTITTAKDTLSWTDDQLKRRGELEAQLDSLRLEKASTPDAMSNNQWMQQLEAILMPLTELYHEVETQSNP